MIGIVFEKIIFVGREYVTELNRNNAYNLCKGIDIADTPFIALCLQLDALLWTGDQKLKDGLKLRNFNKFYN
jgi:predicted nucleic acid-binding protein